MAIPVRVSAAFGYVRSWSDRARSGFTALGLRRPFEGEAPMTINGVIYPVVGNDMSAFDEREKGYVRVEVPRALIEAVSWQPLPAQGTVWVYVPKAEGRAPGEGLPVPDARFPLVESLPVMEFTPTTASAANPPSTTMSKSRPASDPPRASLTLPDGRASTRSRSGEARQPR